MIRKFSSEDIDRILDGDRHGHAALAKLERAGLKRDRWLKGLLVAVANSPYQSAYLRMRKERTKSSRKIWYVPVMANAKAEPDDYRALPEGTRWNERRLHALPDKLMASADQVELSMNNNRVITSVWLDQTFARYLPLPQLMRGFADALREALSRRWLTVQMDAREHARTLLDIVKRQTGRSHYSEVADVLRPIYAAAGLDPHSEGWPTAESLKMLARRGKIRRKRFLARSLKRLGRISGTR